MSRWTQLHHRHARHTAKLGLMSLAALALAAGLAPAPAAAGVITVQNNSFEDGLTGWTAGGVTPADVTSVKASISWQYPLAPDGTNWLMINADQNQVNDAWQKVGTVVADQTYTLTFTVGNSVVSNGAAPAFYAGLYTDDGSGGIANTPLARISEADVTFTQVRPNGTNYNENKIVIGDATVTYDASADPQNAGKNLYIYFASQPVWYTHTLFDDVQLTSSAAPEPATGVLALLGLGGLLIWPRRKRQSA